MKKNAPVAVSLAGVILFIAFFVVQVNIVSANMIPLPTEPPKDPPIITILLPERNNTVIASSELNLTYIVSIPASWKDYLAPVYSPIEESIGSVDLLLDSGYLNNDAHGVGNHSKILQIPSDGNHTLVVSVTATVSYRPPGDNGFPYQNYLITGSSTIYFEVDTTAPTVTLEPMENKTYSEADIPLNFRIDEPASWVGYSLDEQDNVTLTTNTTLMGLSEGTHSLVVYARDNAGNTGTAKTINFTIAFPPSSTPPPLTPSQLSSQEPTQPTSSPSPNVNPPSLPFAEMTVGAVSVAAVLAVGASLMFYKRRKTYE
jgi:hypothetical protein